MCAGSRESKSRRAEEQAAPLMPIPRGLPLLGWRRQAGSRWTRMLLGRDLRPPHGPASRTATDASCLCPPGWCRTATALGAGAREGKGGQRVSGCVVGRSLCRQQLLLLLGLVPVAVESAEPPSGVPGELPGPVLSTAARSRAEESPESLKNLEWNSVGVIARLHLPLPGRAGTPPRQQQPAT